MTLGTTRQGVLAAGLWAGAHGFRSAAEGYSFSRRSQAEAVDLAPALRGHADCFSASAAVHPPLATSSIVSRSA